MGVCHSVGVCGCGGVFLYLDLDVCVCGCVGVFSEKRTCGGVFLKKHNLWVCVCLWVCGCVFNGHKAQYSAPPHPSSW